LGSSPKVLMIRLRFNLFVGLSALSVPFLTLSAPSWLSLMGVGPAWSIMWLLPWSLLEGPGSGLLSGFALGLALDAISLGDATHVPVLAILGLWWGYLGKRSLLFQRGFSLGLLAWIGSIFLSLSLWFQLILSRVTSSINLFNSWSLHTLLGQSILTGILAPLLCSLLLMWFKRYKFSSISNLTRDNI